MTLDIRGSLKNTKINNNKYIVIDEMLSNAIDSYLIRKNQLNFNKAMEVEFNLEFLKEDLYEDKYDLSISCIDNGLGLGNEQVKAFITKDTTYKDGLSVLGVGKCKGSGRVQYFHYFDCLEINSEYIEDGLVRKRTLNVDGSSKEIDATNFNGCSTSIELDDITTKIKLSKLKGSTSINKTRVEIDFSASNIYKYILFHGLHRLITLKDVLGDFSIKIKSKLGDEINIEELVPDCLPNITSSKKITVYGEDKKSKEDFSVSHYKLSSSEYVLAENVVYFCAKAYPVTNLVKRYLLRNSSISKSIDGYFHILLIESDYLDVSVNEMRDDFNIQNNNSQSEMYVENRITYQDIFEYIDDYINGCLAAPDWDKDALMDRAVNRFGVTRGMIQESKIKIHAGDTEESLVKRVLAFFQTKVIEDTSMIFDIKESISNVDPKSADFRSKVNELAWHYTASLKNIDMLNLSQVIVRRSAIIEILSLAANEKLNVHQEEERKQNEKIIHNIFFPMQKDSSEVKDHDMWLLNEEYHYFDYIASDMPLSKIQWSGSDMLFESDIDDELTVILNSRYEGNKLKRPDVALFSEEGAAIIIEFKAPGVSMDNHTGDLMEYAQLLAAKSNGKLKKFYGYLIGTDINPNRVRGYTRFPTGEGWFGTENIMDYSTNMQLGELYSEILFYDDIAKRANKRLGVYKTRLGVDF